MASRARSRRRFRSSCSRLTAPTLRHPFGPRSSGYRPRRACSPYGGSRGCHAPGHRARRARPAWLGVIGLIIGLGLVIGSLEFVGRTGDHGWMVTERLVPVAHTLWSFWLIAFGLLLFRG